MKLTKKLEAEILKVYHAYWDAYLTGDVQRLSSAVADEVDMIGTVESEVFYSKADVMRFYKQTSQQLAGKAEFRNRDIRVVTVDPHIVVCEKADLYIRPEGEWILYSQLRLSTRFKKSGKRWQIFHQHGSLPDTRAQEGETIAFEKISRENLELRDAVKRRTVELEQKNRELEIEAALERVRAVAMGMKQPADMVEVCRMISDQLELLNVRDIRNVQTAIINEATGIYLNYEFFTQYKRTSILEIETKLHPTVVEFANEMLKSSDAFFTKTFKGKALQKWREYRRRTNQDPDPLLDTATSVHYYFYSIGPGALGVSTYAPLEEENIAIFRRFRNVFELAYRRFIDIELAIGQAKEARIEAALERVRAAAMSMHTSDDLKRVGETIFSELKSLGFSDIRNTEILINNDTKESILSHYYSDYGVSGTIEVFYNTHPVLKKWADDMKKASDAFAEVVITEQEMDGWRKYREEIGYLPDPKLNEAKSLWYYSYSIGLGALSVSSFSPITEEQRTILERFRNVFGLAYRRYADVAQAEAQAREANIEAALERVRSRTMGMQTSEELKDVIQIVYDQFVQLNIHTEHAGFIMDYKTRDDFHGWIADRFGTPSQVTLPYFDAIYYNRFNEAKEKGLDFFALTLSFEEKNRFYHDLFQHIPGFPEESKKIILDAPAFTISTVLLENVAVYVENFAGMPYSEEENATLMRFGKVFEQAYTRFLDLQKAEAQAREAQIEAALERVRSRTLAMQKSDELAETAAVLFKQLIALGIAPNRLYIAIIKNEEADVEFWITDEDGSKVSSAFAANLHANGTFWKMFEGWQKGEKSRTIDMQGEELQEYFRYLTSLNVPFKGGLSQKRRVQNIAYFSKGFIGIASPDPQPVETTALLERFAAVFNLTFTRFLDLQKAEAQAREAQIELSLERIRAKVTAMKESLDLLDIVVVMRSEFVALGHEAHYFWHMRWLPDTYEKAMTSGDGTRIGMVMKLPRHIHGDIKLVADWEKSNESTLVFAMDVDTAVEYVHKMITQGDFEQIDPNAPTLDDIRHIGGLTFVMARTTHGEIGFSLPGTVYSPPKEAVETLARFAGVFDLAYRRFEDLKSAEYRNREAQIELALERVRARALAMQEPEELIDVARVLREEMGALGVEELETSTIFIHDDGADTAGCWFAIKDTKQAEKRLVADHITLDLNATWVGREMLAFFDSDQGQVSIPMQGADRREWIEYCYTLSRILDGFYGEHIPDRTYHLYKFNNGAIGAAAPGAISETSWGLLSRAASVFSLAYSRFRDLSQARIDLQRLKEEKKRAEEALTELRATQEQLLQQEKLASLGQLTAGIAHEIKNPLNFVNNFSSVSVELVDEAMVEIKKLSGNGGDAQQLLDDVKKNLNKIIEHGTRADGIVKSMLQHSRGGSGKKEPTDLNALVKEYANLAFHGMRAGKNPINVDIALDLDPSVGTVPLIAEDFSRVVLNLCQNAFDAMREKLNSADKSYLPKLLARTRRDSNRIVIEIEDNGPGIPDAIKDKILQPFFTTKKGTQGTGLGLSITHDIVKAHGGTMTIESSEPTGSTFRIAIPQSGL